MTGWLAGWLVEAGRHVSGLSTAQRARSRFSFQLQAEARDFSPAAAARMPLCVLVGSGAKEGLTEQPLPRHGM